MTRLFRSVLAGAFFCAPGVAQAAQCREMSTVVSSASSLAQNAKDFGHLAYHIAGEQTLAGKTRFLSFPEFTAAYTALRGLTKNQQKCDANTKSGGTVKDCIDAKTAQITGAQLCNKTDDQHKCVPPAGKSITAQSVVFWYENSDRTKNNWILMSAYPDSSACTAAARRRSPR